jgi:LDH2 family malate/lactate/ureidoglycolate dehydrogenase
VDGGNGMGHLVMKFAAQTAIAKARIAGVGWVGARMSNHAGPAALYAMMPLEAGMIGLYLAVGSANHLAPWGGLDLLLSTNPIAVAVPAQEEPPIVLDMATTVAAYGKVKTAAQRGEQMPVGWMIDREGRPLTDPKRANEGLLLPLGGMEAGFKGYGLSLVFGLLAGTLNGAAMGRDVVDFNNDDTSVTDTGHAIVAIDPAAFGEAGEIRANVDALIREIRGSKRLPGVERIWMPGEQSHHRRIERLRDGIPVPAQLAAGLDTLAADLGIARLRAA